MTFKELKELLLSRNPLPPLIPEKIWREDLTKAIRAIDQSHLCKAGLHLWNDDIEACHNIAQANEIPDGNYLHAILHRRQPDYWNSKYWYKRVGNHPVLQEVKKYHSEWDPFQFVDRCEEAEKGKSTQSRKWLEEVQATEMRLLLEHVIQNSSLSH